MVVIMKIYIVEWILVILNNSVLWVGVCVNFGFSFGKEVLDWLVVYNISVSVSSGILKLIVGFLVDFNGVFFFLIEEFVFVYCMYLLFFDYLYICLFLIG